MGIGDWGLGTWALGYGANPPTPNPQSPIPNPHIDEYFKIKFYLILNKFKNKHFILLKKTLIKKKHRKADKPFFY